MAIVLNDSGQSALAIREPTAAVVLDTFEAGDRSEFAFNEETHPANLRKIPDHPILPVFRSTQFVTTQGVPALLQALLQAGDNSHW